MHRDQDSHWRAIPRGLVAFRDEAPGQSLLQRKTIRLGDREVSFTTAPTSFLEAHANQMRMRLRRVKNADSEPSKFCGFFSNAASDGSRRQSISTKGGATAENQNSTQRRNQTFQADDIIPNEVVAKESPRRQAERYGEEVDVTEDTVPNKVMPQKSPRRQAEEYGEAEEDVTDDVVPNEIFPEKIAAKTG